VAGALQIIGDKWTLMVVRDLARGARRTTELIAALHPISSRTLVGRLHDMQADGLIERRKVTTTPPGIEYSLTPRGRLLLPLLTTLREVGEQLGCNECDDRHARLGDYCDACPRRAEVTQHIRRRVEDDSIVLL
jgi:DNA-binding HxlR family transcriptional regulator